MMVRCRMAPSPSGRLHVGTAHTTLFNYLFAKHNAGQFVLRIDDSDQNTAKPEFEKDIIASLQWLGIQWDEGPGVEGPYGPYRQSQRGDIYAKYIQKLLDSGKAYRCFCSKEVLDAKRLAATAQKEMYIYDRTCTHLTTAEIENKLASKSPYVVRLINPNRTVKFDDMVRGHIEVDSTGFGDFIVTRSDGSALLNLAVVVDDIEMKITHAIRGEDFLNATPYQILIFEALGMAPPEIANLSFIYAPDHSKLSKRHGATGLGEYQEQGYLPEAMLNFLAFIGWNPGDDREIFSKEELISEFSFERVGKSMPTFNIEKLNWYNSYYIRQKSDAELAELVKPFTSSKLSDSQIHQIIPTVKERLVKLTDFDSLTSFFESAPEYTSELWNGLTDAPAHLNFVRSEISHLSEQGFTDKIKSQGWKVGDFFMSLRIAVCGSRQTPPINEVIRILGKQEALSRLNSALIFLKANS